MTLVGNDDNSHEIYRHRPAPCQKGWDLTELSTRRRGDCRGRRRYWNARRSLSTETLDRRQGER